MTVGELIKELSKYSEDIDVRFDFSRDIFFVRKIKSTSYDIHARETIEEYLILG